MPPRREDARTEKYQQEIDALALAMERLRDRHGYAVVQLSFADVLCLISQVQLALRHPGNVGDSSRNARRIIDDLIGVLDAEEPGVGRILRMGYDPQHDR